MGCIVVCAVCAWLIVGGKVSRQVCVGASEGGSGKGASACQTLGSFGHATDKETGKQRGRTKEQTQTQRRYFERLGYRQASRASRDAATTSVNGWSEPSCARCTCCNSGYCVCLCLCADACLSVLCVLLCTCMHTKQASRTYCTLLTAQRLGALACIMAS